MRYIFGILCLTLCICRNVSDDSSHKILSRPKRETRVCDDKFKILQTHSACRSKSPDVESSGVSSSDIATILQEHNTYRSNVVTPAANMFKMSWDTEIASVAQAWAETCTLKKHDENYNRFIPGRFPVGQNIGTGYLSWSACIKAWNDESKDFIYNSSTNVFEKIGHFTQLVWATSTKLGCGMADCGDYNFHVCNYGPSGNIGDVSTPYISGSTSCQSCPGHCDATNKLCDCGDITCENGGTLDPSTCTCSCLHDFHVGNQCQLNCTDVKQPYMCDTGSYDAAGCKRYSTVPNDCPVTCKSCPYAAFDYKEVGIDVPGGAGVTVHISTCHVFTVGIILFFYYFIS